MVASAMEYSAARKEFWDQKERDPAKVQAMAKNIANLSTGCLSNHQGLAAATAESGSCPPPAKTGRAASSSPDLRSSGSNPEGQVVPPGTNNPEGPPAAAPAAATSTPASSSSEGVASTRSEAPLPSIQEGLDICKGRKGYGTGSRAPSTERAAKKAKVDVDIIIDVPMPNCRFQDESGHTPANDAALRLMTSQLCHDTH